MAGTPVRLWDGTNSSGFADRCYRHGPFISGGNLYAVLFDVTAADGRPCVWKTADPETVNNWTRQDNANRPTGSHLDSLWAFQDGTDIHSWSFLSATGVQHHKFSTSSDTWTEINAVVLAHSDLPIGANTRACSGYVRSDSDEVCLLAGEAPKVKGTNYDRIAVAVDTGAGYGTPTVVDNSLVSGHDQIDYTGPVSELGASDKGYLFFKEANATGDGHLYMRSFSSADVLSPTNSNLADQVSDNITDSASTMPIPACYYDSSGTERITAGWHRDSDNYIYTSEIDNDGTPGAEEQASGNGNQLTNGQPTACLVGDETNDTAWLLFCQATTPNNLFLDENDDSGGWGTDLVLLPGALQTVSDAAWQVYGATGTLEELAQSFKLPRETRIAGVQLVLYKTGSPTDNVLVKLSSSLDGTPLATSDTVAASGLPATPGDWVTFTFSTPAELQKDTTYYLELERDGSRDTSNYANWRRDSTSPVYADGTAWTKGSGSWTQQSGSDFAFRIPSTPNPIERISAATLTRGGTYSLAIVYEDNGTIYYWDFDISAFAVVEGDGFAGGLAGAFSEQLQTVMADSFAGGLASAPGESVQTIPADAFAGGLASAPGESVQTIFADAFAGGLAQALAESTFVIFGAAFAGGLAAALAEQLQTIMGPSFAGGLGSAPGESVQTISADAFAGGQASAPNAAYVIWLADAFAGGLGSAPSEGIQIALGPGFAGGMAQAPGTGVVVVVGPGFAGGLAQAPSEHLQLVVGPGFAGGLGSALAEQLQTVLGPGFSGGVGSGPSEAYLWIFADAFAGGLAHAAAEGQIVTAGLVTGAGFAGGLLAAPSEALLRVLAQGFAGGQAQSPSEAYVRILAEGFAGGQAQAPSAPYVRVLGQAFAGGLAQAPAERLLYVIGPGFAGGLAQAPAEHLQYVVGPGFSGGLAQASAEAVQTIFGPGFAGGQANAPARAYLIIFADAFSGGLVQAPATGGVIAPYVPGAGHAGFLGSGVAQGVVLTPLATGGFRVERCVCVTAYGPIPYVPTGPSGEGRFRVPREECGEEES